MKPTIDYPNVFTVISRTTGPVNELGEPIVRPKGRLSSPITTGIGRGYLDPTRVKGEFTVTL